MNDLCKVLTVFAFVPNYVSTIKCYECFVTKNDIFNNTNNNRLCDNFDYSDLFLRDCVNSTFCKKTIYRGNIGESLERTERGCADQLYYGLRYQDTVWYDEWKVVKDAYSEGCSHSNNFGFKTVDKVDCYCASDLCNSANSHFYSSFIGVLGILQLIFITICI